MASIVESKVIFDTTEKEYGLVKRGREQASQIVRLSTWLSKYGSKVMEKLYREDEKKNPTTNELILNMVGVLDEAALLDAFTLITGCTKKEADEEFDIAVLIEAAIETFNQNESFTKVLNRFFFVSK